MCSVCESVQRISHLEAASPPNPPVPNALEWKDVLERCFHLNGMLRKRVGDKLLQVETQVLTSCDDTKSRSTVSLMFVVATFNMY